MKRRAEGERGGFTLLEIIATLLIVAVVGAMMFTVLGASITQSSLPITRLQVAFSCQQVMENFTADYAKSYAGDLPGFQTAIGAEGTDQNNGYGKYTVVDNHFIKFVANHEQPGSITDNLLKVTIKNTNHETLTTIFVQ